MGKETQGIKIGHMIRVQMKLNISLHLILLMTLPVFSFGQVDFQTPFRDCGLSGSITVYDYNKKEWTMSDSTDSQLQMPPASTFKIINLLIALETGVIKDENDVIGWIGSIDTALYGYRPSTYKDMSVKQAFEVSAGWVFMELAKKVGRERYLHYLKACDYGNVEVTDEPDFWNFGPLSISPRNQVEFLIKVYEGQLPFSKRNLDILSRVMVSEQASTYTIHSKTGWGRSDGMDIGWWVGYVESGGNVHFFATRLVKNLGTVNRNFGQCRIDITKKILADMGAL